MQLRQEFEDLGAFVAAYRGNISRDGMLVVVEGVSYPVGTRVELEISLCDALVLVRGEAEVLGRDRRREGALVLRFVSLDEQSGELIDRLERRLVAEGGKAFRVDEVPLTENAEVAPAEDDESTRETGDVYQMVSEALQVHEPDEEEAEPRAEEQGQSFLSRHRGAVMLAGVGIVVSAIAVVLALLPGRSEGPVEGAFERSPVPTPALAGAVPSPVELTPTESPESTAVEPSPAPPPPSPTQARPTVIAEPPTAGPATRVENLTWRHEDESTVVNIECDGFLEAAQVKHFELRGPPRHVIRLVGIEEAWSRYSLEVGGPLLERIRAWHHDELQPPELHVVLDITEGAGALATVERQERRVVLTLVPGQE